MRMREIATVRVRYGYRKILVLLQREGWAVGKTMVSRLYGKKAWRYGGRSRGSVVWQWNGGSGPRLPGRIRRGVWIL